MSRRAAGTAGCSWGRQAPHAAARSRSCSFPVLRNGCSRKGFGKIHCCPTTVAPALTPPCRRSRGERRTNDCNSHWRLARRPSGLYVSFPRVELNESRARVPSFYVLDILRAIEGRIPPAQSIGERAMQAGGARLAWPAPLDPATAIDDFEHDLSIMGALLEQHSASVKGRARYLYELSPELQAIALVTVAAMASPPMGSGRWDGPDDRHDARRPGGRSGWVRGPTR